MVPYSDLKHLFDLPARQIDIQLVKKLVDLFDVQESVSVLIRLFKRLLQPRHTHTLRKKRYVSRVHKLCLHNFKYFSFIFRVVAPH